MQFFLLFLGLAGLWAGTELTIKGAVSVASRLGVSEFIVGVAILSIGSDLPELAIAIDGAIKNLGDGGQASDVIVGTALGSSLGQIGFALGLAALFAYLTLPRGTVYRHGAILLGSLLLLGVFGFDGTVSRTEGVSLLIVYLIYFATLFADVQRPSDEDSTHASLTRSGMYLLVGLAIVGVSAELTVEGALGLARALDIKETFIAIIVIGLGTSLPEVSISLGAALKNKSRMSVGNLIGSNIFDTLVPIGAGAAISGLSFDGNMLRHELPFLFFLTFVVLFFFLRKRGIQRWEAAVILGLYGGFVLVKVSNTII